MNVFCFLSVLFTSRCAKFFEYLRMILQNKQYWLSVFIFCYTYDYFTCSYQFYHLTINMLKIRVRLLVDTFLIPMQYFEYLRIFFIVLK